jgi:hypothetical protein
MAKSKKADKLETISGVLLAKVDEKHLREVMVFVEKILAGEKEPVADLVERLATRYAELPESVLGACDTCKGVSPLALPVCAFCGVGEDAPKTDAPPVLAVVPDAKEEPPASVVEAGEAEFLESPITGQKLVKVRKEKAAVVEARPSSNWTEQDLDARVAEVYRFKGDAAAGQWDVGRVVQEIYAENLWQLRLQKDGKPRYKTWESFVLQELKMSHPNVKLLMDVSQAYSREQVHALGTHKLGLTMTLPPEDRPRLLAAIEGGASKREVEEEVRRTKKEKGFRRPNRESPNPKAAAQAGTVAKGSTGRKPREEKVTVAQITGKTTVKLYKKPASMKNIDMNSLVRAKRHSDVPWAMHKLSNNVQQSFMISEDGAGFWTLVIETRRVEE